MLYIDNVTNSNYKYGMMTYAKMTGAGMNISGSYTVMRDGMKNAYVTLYSDKSAGIIRVIKVQ
ncbi:MAG: hypothetical protein IKV89_05660 [Clostridia bacterium]|nr:hypothetical protein [Clostridia bacterium]